MRQNLQMIAVMLSAILAAALPAARADAQPSPSGGPNILWITSEDNSPYLGCYGDKLAYTPNLDRLAAEGVRYRNAFANSPVCSTARTTLITGMYGPTLGTDHHRSRVAIPAGFKLYPEHLRAAGYYCTNNSKMDYNLAKPGEPWDESSNRAHYKNRAAGQPFFAVFNLTTTHEGQLTEQAVERRRKQGMIPPMPRVAPDQVKLPPYHADTPVIRRDWSLYYDNVTAMDAEAGKLIEDLDAAALADNTIVIYCSDHGGALPRGKRNIHDSGTRVPLIIRFPRKWAHLAPAAPGEWVDRPVSFVDLTATLLHLAGAAVPEHYQGRPFLGPNQPPPRDHVFLFRGRMDERYDTVRAIRDTQFRYVRNYSPHRPWGQHYSYPFEVIPSMSSWHEAFLAGNCNEVQARYWRSKPAEELYDLTADPFEVHNLAADPQHAERLAAMRTQLRGDMLEIRDTGFIPEGMRPRLASDQTLYGYAHSDAYPLERIIDIADAATSRDPAVMPKLLKAMADPHPVIRYWGATGCVILQGQAASAKAPLMKLLNDEFVDVRVVAAEALGYAGAADAAVQTLAAVLKSGNEYEVLAALNALEYMWRGGHVDLPRVQAMVRGLKLKEPADRVANYLLSVTPEGG